MMTAIGKFAEQKYYDRQFGYTNFDWVDTGSIIDLTSVPQGAGDTQRIGDKLLISSLEIRMHYGKDSTTTGPTVTDQHYRIIVFKWLDDTTPTADNILDTTSNAFAVISAYDHDRKVKRKVLLDKSFSVTINAPLFSLQNTGATMSFYIDLKRRSLNMRKVHYENASTAGVGKLYMLLISNTPLPITTTNYPVAWFMSTRLNFTDT